MTSKIKATSPAPAGIQGETALKNQANHNTPLSNTTKPAASNPKITPSTKPKPSSYPAPGSLLYHSQAVGVRRLINDQYFRGVMEGRQQAAMEMARCLDLLLQKHDHIALAGSCVAEGEEGAK